MLKYSSILICLILLIIFGGSLSAQLLPGGNYEETEKELKQTEKRLASVSGQLNMSDIRDEWSYELGLRVDVRVTRGIFVCFNFGSIVSHNIDVNVPDNSPGKPFLRNTYYDIGAEYLFEFHEYIKPAAFIGIGVMSMNYSSNVSIDALNNPSEEWFFYSEPGIIIDLKIYESLYFSPGISYKLPFSVDFYDLGTNDLTGMVLKWGIKWELR